MNKISYDTALKLKEAGWPQLGDGDAIVLDWPIPESDETVTIIPWALYVHNPMLNRKVVYGPTLEELIDGVGEAYFNLQYITTDDEGWMASKYPNQPRKYKSVGYQRTASEAVANLWLLLHPLEESK